MKKYQIFYMKIFIILVVKFSEYLNRLVFVMKNFKVSELKTKFRTSILVFLLTVPRQFLCYSFNFVRVISDVTFVFFNISLGIIGRLCSVIIPVSILRKSISGRHRPVRVADGPMTARCRFT